MQVDRKRAELLQSKMLQCSRMCERVHYKAGTRSHSIKDIFQRIYILSIYNTRRHSIELMQVQGVQGIGREFSSGLSLPSDDGSSDFSGGVERSLSANGPRVEHIVAPREDTVINLVREAFNLPQVRAFFVFGATELIQSIQYWKQVYTWCID